MLFTTCADYLALMGFKMSSAAAASPSMLIMLLGHFLRLVQLLCGAFVINALVYGMSQK